MFLFIATDCDVGGYVLDFCVESQLRLNLQAKQETTEYLEAKNISHLFKPNSWQRRMVQHCRSKMSVSPMKAQAVLFYSQKRLGEMDPMSIHGGCPVLQGEKWAANL